MGRVHQPGHEDGQEREHQDGVEAGRDRTRRGLGQGCPRWRTPAGAVPVPVPTAAALARVDTSMSVQMKLYGWHRPHSSRPRRTREPVQSVGFHSGVRPRHRLGARCARSAGLHAGRALALAQRTSRRLPQIRNTVGVSSATPRNAGRGQRRTTAPAPPRGGPDQRKTAGLSAETRLRPTRQARHRRCHGLPGFRTGSQGRCIAGADADTQRTGTRTSRPRSAARRGRSSVARLRSRPDATAKLGRLAGWATSRLLAERRFPWRRAPDPPPRRR